MKTSSSTRPVKKKNRANLAQKPVSGKPLLKKGRLTAGLRAKRYASVDYVAVGADTSMATISLAGIAKVKGKDEYRHGAAAIRWERGTDYFDRMRQAARASDLMIDLFQEMKIMPNLEETYVAIEEPFPLGMVKQMESNSLKQQTQISGAFIGGLLRWGYAWIYEIQANKWRKVVADDLGITIHHTKWNPGGKSDNTGKYRAQEWVEKFHPEWDGHWPDLIEHSKRGLITRPDDSRAKGKQSDDRYEAFAMAEWMRREIEKSEGQK